MRKIPINKPSITSLEISYVNDAIQNGWGDSCYQYINRFETYFANYQNSKYALATSSCTGAIHLALMALGISAGDEVIVPEITWIASVEPVLYIGAKPVFVDISLDSWCICPISFKKAITNKTKAVIVVHLYGNVANMSEIIKIAEEYGLKIIEDAAEGLGSEFEQKKCGSIGDIGVFSFHGTKTMTTGEGGILVTNNENYFKKAKVLNDHGRNAEDRDNKPYWMRDYGYKYKMSNLQAALGCAQIERVEELVSKKRKIFKWYKELIGNYPFELNNEKSNTTNSYWLPTVILPQNLDRQIFFNNCVENQIDSRPFFYPLSSLPMFESNKSNKVAYELFSRGINLPSYHDMMFEDVQLVVNTLVKSYF